MINQRVEELRSLMKKHGIDAYLLPGTDPHQCEQYLPEHWRRRAFISGFKGTYGNIGLTFNKAMLWTDGRYEIEARQKLTGTPFDTYIKEQHDTNLSIEIKWFIDELLKGNGGIIGIDPQLITMKQADIIKDALKTHSDISLKYIEKNLVDEIWKDQPPLPNTSVIFRDKKHENTTASQKIERFRDVMVEKEVDMHIISNLESIARILNVRASDVQYTPLAISYLIIDRDKTFWFIDKNRLPSGYESQLPSSTTILPYKDFSRTLQEISKEKTILVDPGETSQMVLNNIASSANIKKEVSPTTEIKAIKNKFELDNMFEAHIQDGVSVIKTIHWLKTEIKKRDITEWNVVEKINEFKKEQKDFISLSFDPVVAYKSNAAIIHYMPHSDSSYATMKPESIVLIDNGAHYLGGTTDMTRTIALGKVSQEIKENYTRILKGHLNIARIKFPYGTKADQLDTLARQFLWAEGLEYQHGTGHGIGYCTCVHETTNVGLSPLKHVILEEGMTFTDEPGYYKEGEYGIRIENVVAIEKDEELTKRNGKRDFLRLRQMTVCPYEKELIITDLLNAEEINWINNYHKFVLKNLRTRIKDQELLDWLENAC
ncbi:MAG: aminopeptidase family protein P, partial [Proteobacteria bacterium]|nr:aminopeptidase family protein P [Pseudomonadota bacterium]